jgi:hypothetical protein
VRRSDPHGGDPFAAIDPAALGGVTGGRFTPVPGQSDPLLQAVGQLMELIQAVGQNLVQTKQAGEQQMMQLMQQMMQARGS